jgi:glycerol-1-phosphatase
VPLTPLAARYDQFILDLDGCVWVGGEPTPGVVEALEELRDSGKRFAFATNNAFESGEDLVAQLWKIGVRASLGDVVTVGGAMQHRLSEQHTGRTAYVIGSPPMLRHVGDAGLKVMNGTDLASRAEVVVVAGTTELVYADLRNAIQAVLRGADLLCGGRDATFPMPDGPWPGAGPVVAAIEAGTGATARSVGKPDPQLFLTALDRLGPGRAIVVGDRLDVDAAGARAAGLDSAIVLTGATTADEASAADPAPTHVADSLGDLVLGA